MLHDNCYSSAFKKESANVKEQFFGLYLYSYILIIGMAGMKIEA
jgi:hypothetical protein